MFLRGGNAIVRVQLFDDRLAQLCDPRRWRISRFVFSERRSHCLLYVIRSRAIRLTAFELMDSRALCAQAHDPIADFHNVGKADVIKP